MARRCDSPRHSHAVRYRRAPFFFFFARTSPRLTTPPSPSSCLLHVTRMARFSCLPLLRRLRYYCRAQGFTNAAIRFLPLYDTAPIYTCWYCCLPLFFRCRRDISRRLVRRAICRFAGLMSVRYVDVLHSEANIIFHDGRTWQMKAVVVLPPRAALR